MKNGYGWTLVEIMIVAAIIAILAALAIPGFMKARQTTYTNICKNNLRLIDAAKQQWAIENNMGAADAPVEEYVLSYIKGKSARCYCPLDSAKQFSSSYEINAVAVLPACKIKPVTHKI